MDALTRDISEGKHKQRSGVIKVPAATAPTSAKKEHPRNDILRLDYIYKRKIPPRTAIATAQETLQWTRSRLQGLFGFLVRRRMSATLLFIFREREHQRYIGQNRDLSIFYTRSISFFPDM